MVKIILLTALLMLSQNAKAIESVQSDNRSCGTNAASDAKSDINEPLDREKALMNIDAYLAFVLEKVDPAVSILDQEKLIKFLEKSQVNEYEDCGGPIFQLATKQIFQRLDKNSEQCDFFQLALAIKALNHTIKGVSECALEKCSVSSQSIAVGQMMQQSYRGKLLAKACREWVARLN
ncbi:MAG: hypothetical protein OEZ43_19095 [Gammaproteobacteria bacterium]|nr:hypothetical protein [Gammaproteobacteria bacterium]